MYTKEQLEGMLKETETLKGRVDAAEMKSKELETENLKLQTSMKTIGNRSDSDEAKALRYFGVSHPKQLLSINVASPAFRMVPDELKHLVLNFKKAVDVSRFTAQMFHGAALDDVRGDSESPAKIKGLLETRYGREILVPALKAFGSTVVGGGDEWVPTATASSYIDEYSLERVLEQRFKVVNMPTNPFDQPVVKQGTKARKSTEGTIMTAGQFQTDKLTMSAVKLAEYYEIPEELNEDSAPDFLAAGRDHVVKAQKDAVEAALLNGDSDGTHIDSDTQALGADIAEKIWNGLRREALSNSANGSTFDFTNAIADESKLRTLRARLGKFGKNEKELCWIVGTNVYTQMLGFDTVATLDKFGPNATVLQGAISAYQGIPIICSEYMREDLNANGVFDGITSTKAAMLLVNLTRWYIGNRRPIQVKLMMDLPYHDRWLLASYRRVAFKGFAQSATETSVVYGYNIAK
jgi:HK97 family phage major capsid protein